MRVDTRPRHRNSGRQHEGKRSRGHIQWLRGRPCILSGKPGHECAGRMEAAHYDGAGGKGTALKVSDAHAFPACSDAHAELHRIGQLTWQARWKVNLMAATQAYLAASPHKGDFA